MPHTRPGLGIGSLRNGAENYQACLYFHTSVNFTAEEIHEIGKKEVARIYALIKQVCQLAHGWINVFDVYISKLEVNLLMLRQTSINTLECVFDPAFKMH